MMQNSQIMQNSPRAFSQNTPRAGPTQSMASVDLFGYVDSLPDRMNCTVARMDRTLNPKQNTREDVSVAPPPPPAHRARQANSSPAHRAPQVQPPQTHRAPQAHSPRAQGAPQAPSSPSQRDAFVAPKRQKQQSLSIGARQLPPPPAQNAMDVSDDDDDDELMLIETCSPTVVEIEDSFNIETCTPTMLNPGHASVQPFSQPSSENNSQSDSQPPPPPPVDYMTESVLESTSISSNPMATNMNFDMVLVSSVSDAIHSQNRVPLMMRFGY